MTHYRHNWGDHYGNDCDCPGQAGRWWTPMQAGSVSKLAAYRAEVRTALEALRKTIDEESRYSINRLDDLLQLDAEGDLIGFEAIDRAVDTLLRTLCRPQEPPIQNNPASAP